MPSVLLVSADAKEFYFFVYLFSELAHASHKHFLMSGILQNKSILFNTYARKIDKVLICELRDCRWRVNNRQQTKVDGLLLFIKEKRALGVGWRL